VNKKGLQGQEELLRSGLRQLEIALEEQSITNLLSYMEELQKWNKKINLIARNTLPVDIIEKHFLDSLTLLPFVDRQEGGKQTLLDVGTGAGFPGLVLAAVLPDLDVILVEPRSKRVSFLRHIIRTLALDNVRVFAERLENIPELAAMDIDFVTSRAVAEPTIFLPMVASFLDQGAGVLLMLSRGSEEFRQQAGGWAEIQLQEENKYVLPFSGGERMVYLVRKK
jgi:16S rRNA (guanine527-N7)-methyltransferase